MFPPSLSLPCPFQAKPPAEFKARRKEKHFTGGSFRAQIQQTDRLINKTKKWERRNTPLLLLLLLLLLPLPLVPLGWSSRKSHSGMARRTFRKEEKKERERERSVSATAMRLTRREKTWSTGSLRIDQKLRQENWKKRRGGGGVLRGEGQSGRTQQRT